MILIHTRVWEPWCYRIPGRANSCGPRIFRKGFLEDIQGKWNNTIYPLNAKFKVNGHQVVQSWGKACIYLDLLSLVEEKNSPVHLLPRHCSHPPPTPLCSVSNCWKWLRAKYGFFTALSPLDNAVQTVAFIPSLPSWCSVLFLEPWPLTWAACLYITVVIAELWCFSLLAIINHTAMTVHMHVCMWTYVFISLTYECNCLIVWWIYPSF